MARAKCTEEEFRKLFTEYGAAAMAELLSVTERSIMRRRRFIENKTGEPIQPPSHTYQNRSGRISYDITDGTIIVFSDCHYWPGIVPVMHRALVRFCKEFKPDYVIANGDILDFASISRFPPIGHEERPLVVDELEASQERMEEIRNASGSATLHWNIGNHDIRYNTLLAKHLPELQRVKGTRLTDHFPHWPTSWSVWFHGSNDVPLVIKHRIRGGIHAVRNNILATRRHTATGHCHGAHVIGVSAYEDRLWGADCGMIADCFGPQFEIYTEDGPRDWQSAFGLFTFYNGRLMKPELCLKINDNTVEFRAESITV